MNNAKCQREHGYICDDPLYDQAVKLVQEAVDGDPFTDIDDAEELAYKLIAMLVRYAVNAGGAALEREGVAGALTDRLKRTDLSEPAQKEVHAAITAFWFRELA